MRAYRADVAFDGERRLADGAAHRRVNCLALARDGAGLGHKRGLACIARRCPTVT